MLGPDADTDAQIESLSLLRDPGRAPVEAAFVTRFEPPLVDPEVDFEEVRRIGQV